MLHHKIKTLEEARFILLTKATNSPNVRIVATDALFNTINYKSMSNYRPDKREGKRYVC